MDTFVYLINFYLHWKTIFRGTENKTWGKTESQQVKFFDG